MVLGFNGFEGFRAYLFILVDCLENWREKKKVNANSGFPYRGGEGGRGGPIFEFQ